MILRHSLRLVLREPRRSLAAIVGIAIAAALITSVLLFGAASGNTVTRRALADLPVDAQVIIANGGTAAAARSIVTADPAVRAVSDFQLAHFDSAATNKAGTATQTSVGVLIGIDAGYTSQTGLFGLSSGSLQPGQIAISRDLASNLGAVPGDTISFSLPGGATVALRVSGIVSIAGADLLLGPIDPAHRAAGANPPTNVAIMAAGDLASMVLPRIPTGAVATDPGTAGAAGRGPATPVFAPEPAVRMELHVRLDHAQLPGDPASAQLWLDSVRRRVERQGAGAFTWVDDASASLEPLGADLAWGQILFIFLALPGIMLALALSRLAADATADSTRRHAALLRARGAKRPELVAVFVGATVLTALGGSCIGAVIGAAAAVALFGTDLAAAGGAAAILAAIGVAVLLTTLLATAAALLPLRAQLREEIGSGRQELQRNRPPLWQRLGLDVVALVGGVVVYVVAGGAGLHPVLNAEGNPTVTLALTSFLAPLLFWLGGTLLLLRIVGFVLRRGGWLAASLRRPLGPGGDLAARSLVARAGAAARAIVVLALAVGFATSVLMFDATYRQQQRVDAELTLGADLKVTPTGQVASGQIAGLSGPGIAAVTPFVDRVVYVGPEAQDLLAIDTATLPAVAPLADSFFAGSGAAAAMAALRARPDAILVSSETAKDYSIVPGDRLRIRVPDATGTLRTVEFTMAGIALEFPTAPKDAFLVGNLAYVAAQTGNDRISFALARADGDVAAASAAVAARLGAGWQVADLSTTSARLANSITAVDLRSLVGLDVSFAIVIAAVGVALFLLAGLADRRRELATLIAIGAEPRQVRSTIAGEALVVGVAGIGTGLLTGGLVGLTLLQILAGVFDPPADLPAIPLTLTAAMTAAIIVSLLVALAVADRGLSRLSVVAALRER
ncbi:MAG TPA: ABC transporter permease [Candidatus Dormibacteraeota bacterium]|nr:ABC transporter permease [Candidatus Dormibacteraeota bacterium]